MATPQDLILEDFQRLLFLLEKERDQSVDPESYEEIIQKIEESRGDYTELIGTTIAPYKSGDQ
jgi:hypothetical protein